VVGGATGTTVGFLLLSNFLQMKGSLVVHAVSAM
jgi:hypothetical protein